MQKENHNENPLNVPVRAAAFAPHDLHSAWSGSCSTQPQQQNDSYGKVVRVISSEKKRGCVEEMECIPRRQNIIRAGVSFLKRRPLSRYHEMGYSGIFWK